jgi:hypothetical protein
MKVIAEVQHASPSRARDGREMSQEASPEGRADMYPQVGFVPEETHAPPPPAGQGSIPALSQNQVP